MPAPENATIYGIQIRESANDGSDFSNAATDYRKLFLGEDGLLHVKDSAGTVTSPYSSSAVADIDYVEVTSPTNITATTEATANTIITGSAVAYDGSTTVFVIAYFPYWQIINNSDSQIYLYDGSSSIGSLALLSAVTATGISGTQRQQVYATRKLTPSAATHTYSIRGRTSTGTASAGAGAGGNGNHMPAYLRIVRVG